MMVMLAVLTATSQAQSIFGEIQADSTFTNAEADTLPVITAWAVEHDFLFQYELDASVTGTTTGNILLQKSQTPDGPWVTNTTISAGADASAIVTIQGNGWSYYRLVYAVTGTSTWRFNAYYAAYATDDMSLNMITPQRLSRLDTLTNTDTVTVALQWSTFGPSHLLASVGLVVQSGAEAATIEHGYRVHPSAPWIFDAPVALNAGAQQFPAADANTPNTYPFNALRIINATTGVVEFDWNISSIIQDR